jgi:hypothetical protein
MPFNFSFHTFRNKSKRVKIDIFQKTFHISLFIILITFNPI